MDIHVFQGFGGVMQEVAFALVPLLILIYGFTLTPRIIAVALAVGAGEAGGGLRLAWHRRAGRRARDRAARPAPSLSRLEQEIRSHVADRIVDRAEAAWSDAGHTVRLQEDAS